jgi:NAD(P)-dependent dehydrogenase (short-subunit alcohol dehydrogenase family)
MSAPALPPTVLVTGAAKRLGREIALQLAENGWRVAVHYRDSVEEARRTVADCARLTLGAQAFRSNFGNETAVRNLLPTVIEKMGHVDAVVHCATTQEPDSAASFSYAAMERHMRYNTGAAILLGQGLHQHLLQRRISAPQASGVVVNLLNQAPWGKAPDYVSYNVSKAALDAACSLLEPMWAPCLRLCTVKVAQHPQSQDDRTFRHGLAREVLQVIVAKLGSPHEQ